MKKNVFTLLSLMMLSFSFLAQEKINLVIFSEDGDAFFAFVNGIRQNDKAETNVKVTGLSPNVSLRLEFADKALPSLKQAMPLEPNQEHTMRIKRNNKGELKLRYFGATELGSAESDASSGGATTIQYHSTENPMSDNASVNVNTNANAGNVAISSSTTTTTKTVTKGNADAGDNVAVNINMGGMGGIGINMNVTGMDGMSNTNMNTTTSTTVTQSSSSSYSGNSEVTPSSNANSAAVSKVKEGCSIAISQANFSKMKQSVESKPFSDTKMSTAKVATKNSCLSTNQIKEICKLFSMDDDKLTYAKYAYDYCVDKANYYTVSEVFSFSATTDEFNKFLEH